MLGYETNFVLFLIHSLPIVGKKAAAETQKKTRADLQKSTDI